MLLLYIYIYPKLEQLARQVWGSHRNHQDFTHQKVGLSVTVGHRGPKISIPRSPTVDGRNPTPVDRWFIPLFIGFQPSKVVQDFFHQQYHVSRERNPMHPTKIRVYSHCPKNNLSETLCERLHDEPIL